MRETMSQCEPISNIPRVLTLTENLDSIAESVEANRQHHRASLDELFVLVAGLRDDLDALMDRVG